MQIVKLRHLTLEDCEKFYSALNSQWGDFVFAHYWESLAQENFEKYITIIPGFSKGLHIPKEHVSCTFLFAFNEKNELVGRTSIRHELTAFLLEEGGHIGYGVVPEFRKRGYATAILHESLNYVREHLSHIKKVLVTCDQNNIGSQKTIISNGGVLENVVLRDNGKSTMRFWIDVTELSLP